MRHRMRGRKLGRTASHRKAMFRNMASSLIKSVKEDEDDPQRPKIAGRIVTTLAKAKELRPFVEKLVTLAKKAIVHEERAEEFSTDAERGTTEWKSWRESDRWNRWANAIAPAVALRRRAFAALRDKKAVSVLFDEIAHEFIDRPGGYTRVIRIAKLRLGDSGQQAFIEFVGENDRVKTKSQTAPTVVDEKLEQSLEELNLSVKATNALESEAINSVRDLISKQEDQLLQDRNVDDEESLSEGLTTSDSEENTEIESSEAENESSSDESADDEKKAEE